MWTSRWGNQACRVKIWPYFWGENSHCMLFLKFSVKISPKNTSNSIPEQGFSCYALLYFVLGFWDFYSTAQDSKRISQSLRAVMSVVKVAYGQTVHFWQLKNWKMACPILSPLHQMQFSMRSVSWGLGGNICDSSILGVWTAFTLSRSLICSHFWLGHCIQQ